MTATTNAFHDFSRLARMRRVGKGALAPCPPFRMRKDGGHTIDPRIRATRWLLPTLRLPAAESERDITLATPRGCGEHGILPLLA